MAVIKLITRMMIDWDSLRTIVSKATGFNPSDLLYQHPVKFSQYAEYLIFVAFLKLDFNERSDPLQILRTLPHECLDFLHYSFLFGCNSYAAFDLREKTRASFSLINCNGSYVMLGTGALSVWYDAIVLNLTQPEMKLYPETRFLLNHIQIILETDGLQHIFSKYPKKTLPDQTFLLGGKS